METAKGMKLTLKQELFCQYLVGGMKQREAYKKAFAPPRMKDKGISEHASVMANSPKIVARINELKNELKAENATTVNKVLEQLTKIAFSDITNFTSFGKNEITTKDGRVLNVNYVDFKESKDVDGTIIQEVKQGKDGSSLKLSDRLKALELIGKHLGMFTENVNLSGLIAVNIVDDISNG